MPSTDAAATSRRVPSRTSLGLVLAVCSATSFGLSGPFAKSLIDSGWSSGAAVLVRLGGAAIVLLAILLLFYRSRLSQLRSHWKPILLYGVFAMAGVQVCYFNAIRYLPIGVALLLEYLSPLFVIVWVWLVRGRRPSLLTCAGALVAFFGLYLVLGTTAGGGLSLPGVLWGIAAACCQLFFFLVAGTEVVRLDPALLATGGMLVGAALVAMFGVVGVLPLTFARMPVHLAGGQTSWLVPAAFMVLVATVIAYLTGIFAVTALGSTTASFVALLEVLVAVLAAWLLLGQLPLAVQVLGGAVLLAGIFCIQLGGRPRRIAIGDDPPA